ncbi:hypothetical protein AB4Z09_28120 [Rhodococcus sp. TAF43]|uniref:hypothetical protein n=1 Tax=Rhodococcus sp. TAF43 TaxID=3237483 RepID=UPI003F9AACD3
MTIHTEHQTRGGLMDQNIERQNNRAQTQAHDGGWMGLLDYLIENRVKDRRGFWLTLLAGMVLLLAAVYGPPILIGMGA